MLTIPIAGRAPLVLEHLACDFNGTLAYDGALLAGVAERLAALGGALTVHILTAGTHGGIDAARAELDAAFTSAGLASGPNWQMVGTGSEKADYLAALGPERVAAIGNGTNDAPMLYLAALGVAVLGPEGLARAAAEAADALSPSITAALDLLVYPKRLEATLRP